MRRISLSLPLLLALTLGALPAVALTQAPTTSAPKARPKPAQLPADSLERARKFTLWLYTNQTDSLFAYMDTVSQRELKVPKAIEESVAQLAIEAGSEERLIEERWVTRLGRRQYWRKAKFSGIDEPFLVRVVMVAPGTLGGFGFGLASQAPPIDP
jgi:hypothetical protein